MSGSARLATGDLPQSPTVFVGNCDALDRLAVGYLMLPLITFIVGWLSMGAAVVLLVAVAAGTWELVRGPSQLNGVSMGWIATATGLALVWSAFGGAGHLLYANAFDWIVRDAVLHDLVTGAWPVSYAPTEGSLVLRAPVAYFLPAALVGKLAGIGWADLALFFWTAGGVALFTILGLQQFTTRNGKLIWLLLLPIFSGMDALGWWLFKSSTIRPGQHIEWWAYFYQYSSASTLLFWVPNHALAGWIAAMLLYKHWHRTNVFLWIALLTLATVLWSPLVTIGLVPFALGRAVQALVQREPLRDYASLRFAICAASLALPLAFLSGWLTADTASIPVGGTFEPMDLEARVLHFIAFLVLEWGILALLVHGAGFRHGTFVLVCASLAALPLFRFGIGNDLVMRTSIIPLALLMLGAAFALSQVLADRRFAFVVSLCAVLSLGAITPAQEFYRAVTGTHWTPDLASNLQEVGGVQRPPNYIARWDQIAPPLRRLLKAPGEPVAPAGVLRSPPTRWMP